MTVKEVNYNLSIQLEELLEHLGTPIDEFSESIDSIRGPAICHGGDNPTGFSIYNDPPVWCCWTSHCHEDHGCDLIGLISASQDLKRDDAIDFARKFLEGKSISKLKHSKIKKTFNPIEEHLNQRVFPKNILNKLSNDLSYAESRNFSTDILYKMGCGLSHYGPMIDRILFPIENLSGGIVGFTGRTICDDMVKWKHTVFKKSINFVNLRLCNEFMKKRRITKVILVEGPWDVLKLCEAKYWNCLGILGSSVTLGQIEIMKHMGITDVVLLMDNDKGGRKAEERNVEKLKRALMGVEVLYPNKENCDIGDLEVKEIGSMLKEVKWRE